jgi:hypothetical protein
MSYGAVPMRIFNNAAMGVADITSQVMDSFQCNSNNAVGLEIVSTGTPTGVYSMEASNQFDAQTNPSATFVTIASAPTPAFPVPAGAGAQTAHLLPLAAACLGLRYFRMRYHGTGGAGVLNVYAFARST